jgi:tRNA-2-methylthio-N6-dimethylallyladenosine synthase
MAQTRGQELIEEIPAVDLVVGTQKYHRVAEYVDELLNGKGQVARGKRRNGDAVDDESMDDLKSPFWARRRIVDVEAEKGSESTIREHVLEPRQVTAFVSIMQGCEMFCTFCIVPYTRGAERSRPIPEIVDEVRGLVARGVREITLLGQIVNRYGQREFPKRDGQSPFVQLLEALDAVKGLERVRYTSPHPTLFHDDLIEAHGRLRTLCECVHLPVQSGSDRILKAMHRTYTVERYLRVIDALRKVRPAMEFSTDIIVGFPGESEEDFQQTVALMKQVQFDNAFIFKYSDRRNTPAAAMTGKISEKEKLRRNHALLDLMEKNNQRRNQDEVGRIAEVLVEGRSKRNAAKLFGRTRGNKVVIFDGNETRHHGQLLGVRITRATAHTLYGEADILNVG